MDFGAILEQILELVQSQRRVSYRAIKRRFDVADDDLEDLKEEILFAHPHIVDEEGRGLVWTDSEAQTMRSPQSDTGEAPSSAVKTPVTAPPPDAERRQLTVMFCDLVDSTRLAGQLDPEDLREVVRAYQQRAAGVIQQYEGHIAQYLGDGLLVYFGWPRAHEDDAHRAVHTGLSIVEAMDDLNTTLELAYGVQLAVRLGIHTGPVVVGEIGGGDRHENLALGETPNIAARLEGVAEPNTVVMSDATRRLVAGAFDYDALGTPALKGVNDPLAIFRVRGLSAAASRFDATTTMLTPMVGREVEVDLLMRCWEQVLEGEGQVVLLNGPPGIGKSRLLQALCARLADAPHVRLRYQCSPYHTNSVLYPIATQVTRAMQLPPDAASSVKLERLEALLTQTGLPMDEAVPLFALMLSIPTDDHYPPLAQTPQRQKERTLELFAQGLVNLSRQEPVLLLFEDVHWSDPTSLEALHHVIDQVRDARVLVVLTSRPEFEPAWGDERHMTTYTLNRLSRRQTVSLVEHVTGGKALPAEVLEQIVAKTDGIPLFIEELTKHVLESEWLRDAGDSYQLKRPLPPLAIPATLQDSLMARLDRLAEGKEVVQLCATIGREFSYTVLRAVSPLSDTALQVALGQLLDADLISQRGQAPESTYSFKHALIQDTAYQSMVRSRRQQMHQKIAEVLEAPFPETVATQPELVAHHYTEAGLGEPAVLYWQRAGDLANRHSAYPEAIAHVTQGLTVLGTLPETATRIDQEMRLRLALGRPLMATNGMGAPQVGETYARLRQLCAHGEDLSLRFAALRGLRTFYTGRAEHHRAAEIGAEGLRVVQQTDDPMLLAEGYFNAGVPYLYLGQLRQAMDHFSHSLVQPGSVSQPTTAAALDVTCRSNMSIALWLLGYSDQAQQRSHEALTISHQRPDVFTQGMAQIYSLLYLAFRREWTALHEQAVGLEKLATEAGLPQMAGLAAIMLGWHRAVRDRDPDGVNQLRQGIETFRNSGGDVFHPSWLARLAESLAQVGELEDALSTVAEAFEVMQAIDEYVHHAELCWLKGTLLLACSDGRSEEAETCFHQALDVAHAQQAKSLELRAAMSLARLWQQAGKQQEAHDLLAPVYDWFTEGLNTADLREAKALLMELS